MRLLVSGIFGYAIAGSVLVHWLTVMFRTDIKIIVTAFKAYISHGKASGLYKTQF